MKIGSSRRMLNYPLTHIIVIPIYTDSSVIDNPQFIVGNRKKETAQQEQGQSFEHFR